MKAFLYLFFIYFFPGVVFYFVLSRGYLKALSIINPVCLYLFGTHIN